MLARPAHTVLIADDEPRVVRAWQRHMLGLGCECVTAHSVAEGFDVLAASDRIDGAILDYYLGDGTGAQLAQRLRERWATLPVLIATGGGMSEVFIADISSRSLFFSQKPLENGALRTFAKFVEAHAHTHGEVTLAEYIDGLPVTPSERSTLHALVQTGSRHAAAQQRGVSLATVKTQVASALAKTGHPSVRSLVAAWARSSSV